MMISYYLNPKLAHFNFHQCILINQIFSMDYSTRPQPENFQNFFQGWLAHLEFYLHQLLHILPFLDHHDESNVQQLVNRVMTHYHDYFLAKSQICQENVFLVLSPPWLNSYERIFLWLGGSKPGLALYVVKNCGVELTFNQAERMERLTREIKDEEREITERLGMLESQVVAPPMLVLARNGGREVNGMVHEADTAVDRLADEMECLVGCADYLRRKTIAKVVGILTTSQTVRFLASMVQLQLRIRRWGQMRDAEARGNVNLS